MYDRFDDITSEAQAQMHDEQKRKKAFDSMQVQSVEWCIDCGMEHSYLSSLPCLNCGCNSFARTKRDCHGQ